MTATLHRLLEMHKALHKIGFYSAAERVEQAIVLAAFEELMKRNGMGRIL